MKLMGFSLILGAEGRRSAPRGRALAALLVLAALAAVAGVGCKRLHPTDTAPLDKAGLWFRSIEELRRLAVTDAEVAELVKAREAGLSEAEILDLSERGTTDEQAQMILAARQRAAGGSSFVRYHRRHR